MGLTLSTARTYIREDILDDPDSRRYTDAQVQSAIKLALSETHEEYLLNGGDRFLEEITGLTTDSSGKVDLSSYSPAEVRSVLMLTGNFHHRLEPAQLADKELASVASGRSITVQLVRTPTFPDADGEYLLQDAANNQLVSWFAFEDLICVRAALRLCRKDNEIPAGLRADEQRLQKSVMQKSLQRTYTLQSHVNTYYEDLYKYHYNPQEQKVVLYKSIRPSYR